MQPQVFLPAFLEWLGDVIEELGIEEETGYVHTILKEGTSADRQLKTFRATDNLEAVVDQLIAETREGWE